MTEDLFFPATRQQKLKLPSLRVDNYSTSGKITHYCFGANSGKMAWSLKTTKQIYLFIPPLPEGGGGYTVLPLSVQDIFHRTFLSNCWWQKSDIWSQASYRYTILWVAYLDPSDSYFLFADLVGFYTHWTYMHIFRHIFLSNYWWQRSDIWSQASYRYPISRFWIHQIPTSCLPKSGGIISEH
jgi:hypothetical protein